MILDVNTSLDDGIDIMSAALSSDIELLGITTVNGNRQVDITTDCTLWFFNLIGRNIPSYMAAPIPRFDLINDKNK